MATTITNNPIFVPNQISGLQLWLDADDPTTLSTTDTTVNSWTDKAANISFTPRNGTGVTYSNSLVNLASSTFLRNTSSSITIGQTFTFFLIASNTIGASQAAALYLSPLGGGQPGIYVEWPTPTNYRFTYRFPALTTGGSNVLIPAPGVLPLTIGTFYRSLPGANYELGMGINGSLTPTTLSDTQSGPLGASTELVLGANYATDSTSSRFLTGAFAEIIFYNSELTVNQRQQVEGYLAWKWGLQANLPENHPYKNSPVANALAAPNPVYPPQFINNAIFIPTQISGCQIWIDAQDITKLSLTGTTINSITDKSSNSYVFSNVTGFTYCNVNFNGMYPSFFGASYTNGNHLGSNTSVSFNQPATFFAVGKKNDPTSEGYICDTASAAGANRNAIIGKATTQLTSIFAGSELISAAGGLTSNYVNSYILNSTNSFIFVNGTQQANGTAGTQNLTSGLLLGSRFNLTNPYTGDFCEFIVYNSALTTAQRQQVEGYLAWKWGLQGSLPVNHPYRNVQVQVLPLNIPNVQFPPQLILGQWQPTNIAGAVVWFDGADTSTLSLTGTTVNTWTSKGTVALTGTSVGAGAIVYENYLGYNSLRFNGTSTRMTTGTIAAYATTGTTWISVSVNLTTVTTTAPTDASVVIATNSAPERSIRYTGTGAGNTSAQIYTFNNGVARFSKNTENGIRGYIDNAASFTAYVNGVSQEITNQQAVTFQAGANQQFVLGQWNTGYLNGYIQEVVIYNSALNESQYQTVEGYLAWKWGLQATLPSTHPFRNFPPAPT